MEKQSDTYLSVSAPSSGLYKEKGSRFISFLLPVGSAGEAGMEIERLRKEYHDARHCCYAYRIGLSGDVWRMNDDGEPSSTAGRPIFGQILSNSLSDVLIVVVRYFGGIKLGVPGLINAYRSAAADAITKASIIRKTADAELSVTFGYPAMNGVMRAVKDYSPAVIAQDFGLECHLTLRVRLAELELLRDRITKAGGACS